MSLPILSTSSDTLIRLFHKTERLMTQNLAEETQLAAGSAFCNPDLGRVWDANRLLDGALPEGNSPAEAADEVNAHFASCGARCMRWGMNPSAPIEQTAPFIAHLQQTGHQRAAHDIMYLSHLSTHAIAPPQNLKIIPARASFRHARALAEESANEGQWREPQLADAAMLHLDDPHWDALLALRDGNAVAMLGVLAAGEIGRIDQVFVSANARRQGIARTMMTRAMEICVRSLFKHVFLSCDATNAPALALYHDFGFKKIGEIVSYYPSA